MDLETSDSIIFPVWEQEAEEVGEEVAEAVLEARELLAGAACQIGSYRVPSFLVARITFTCLVQTLLQCGCVRSFVFKRG